MENQYKKLFDKIAPIKSDRELLKAVLDRKAEKNMSSKKKFSKKAILIPAAAAALLGTTAIGVSAAYQWNLPAAFEDMFRERFDQYNGENDAAKNVMFDFSTIGKELDLTYNFDKFDVVIKGIAADEHSAYLLYDVVFAEDYDYSLAKGEEWALNLRPNIDLSWVMNYSGEMDPSVDTENGFLNMEGNTAHCFSSVKISGISMQDKPLVYSFDSLIRTTGDNKDITELEETKFSVDMDFELWRNSVSILPNEKITLESGETGIIDYIGLSTFGVELDVEWTGDMLSEENKEDMCEKLKNSITINYKDGTTSRDTVFTAEYLGSGLRYMHTRSEDSYSTSVLLSWVYPVYMRDIDSITIGDKTYNVQSAYNAVPFDFASIGKEINHVYEFDNYTLNVRGLITDGYSAYIVYDVVFDEDFDYAPRDGWGDWELDIRADLPSGNGVPSVVNGNVYTFYHRVGTDDNTTLRGKTVTFEFGDLSRWEMSHRSEKDETPEVLDSETLDCGVTLEVDFDFDVNRGNKTVIGSTPIYLSELFGSGTLTDFTVTPLGIKATVANSDIESAISVKAEYNDFDLALYHADGTMTLIDGFGRLDEGTLYLEGYFEYPLDTSDIVGAKIGNVEVDLSAGKFAQTSSVEQKAPAFDFSSVGKALGNKFEGEGYTLTVNGVVADAHTAHFIYMIEFNDKFPFDYKHTDVKGEGWFDWSVRDIALKVNGEEGNIGMSSSGLDDVWLDENTLQGSFMLSCDEISLENSDVMLTIGSLTRSHVTDSTLDDRQEIDCGMTVDFSLGDMTGMELDLTPNKGFETDGIGNVVISEVKITPFKLTYTVLPADGQQVEFEKFCEAIFKDSSETGVTLKNGAKVSARSGMGAQKNGGMESFMEMSYPVDPADVASVTICGREISLLYSGEATISDMPAIKGKVGEDIENDGFTVRFDAPYVDKYGAYIPYTVKFDSDFINALNADEKTAHNGYGSWVINGEVIDGNGNTCHSVTSSDTGDVKTAAGVVQIFSDNIESEALTIKIDSIYRDIKMDGKVVGTQAVYCNMKAEFNNAVPNTSYLSCVTNTDITLANGTKAVLKRVEVTPTNIAAMVISPKNAMSAAELQNQLMQEQNTYVTLKDGTVNLIGTVWAHALDDGSVLCTALLYNEKGMLTLADAESITVCGYKIDLGNAEYKSPAVGRAPARYDFSQLDGKELNKTLKGDGFTLTLDKVVADIHNAYIFYTLDFDENTNYASGTPSNWGFDLRTKLDGKERSGAVGGGIPYLEDGVLKGRFRLSYPEYDLTDTTLTLSFNSLNYNRTTLSPLEEKHIGFIENVDIAMDFKLLTDALKLTPNVEIKADGVTAVLSDMEITPFGMSYTITLPEELINGDADALFEAVGKVQETLDSTGYGSIPLITFDDGSVGYDLITSGTGGVGRTISNEHTFTRPVDTSKIRSISIGGYTINVH